MRRRLTSRGTHQTGSAGLELYPPGQGPARSPSHLLTLLVCCSELLGAPRFAMSPVLLPQVVHRLREVNLQGDFFCGNLRI